MSDLTRAASSQEASDRADEVRDHLAAVCHGESHEVVLAAVMTLASQVIADMSESPEQARIYITESLAPALIEDITKNWHLVTARRRQG